MLRARLGDCVPLEIRGFGALCVTRESWMGGRRGTWGVVNGGFNYAIESILRNWKMKKGRLRFAFRARPRAWRLDDGLKTRWSWPRLATVSPAKLKKERDLRETGGGFSLDYLRLVRIY